MIEMVTELPVGMAGDFVVECSPCLLLDTVLPVADSKTFWADLLDSVLLQ